MSVAGLLTTENMSVAGLLTAENMSVAGLLTAENISVPAPIAAENMSVYLAGNMESEEGSLSPDMSGSSPSSGKMMTRTLNILPHHPALRGINGTGMC